MPVAWWIRETLAANLRKAFAEKHDDADGLRRVVEDAISRKDRRAASPQRKPFFA